ncbi:mannitol dehydrogenase domain protein [Limosilactobacillus coleohominis 101-4-CHN]|uniref:Mannitol dehydrogenase domain protein n=1 Tax=Limosilactobacillus coleohominis 101-4-CHN TaxID=575594 RepID=C7XV66_9LACO|nr:mannitol dehydrogenase family protein [Limosilactobacillus coleohominis]EEU30232.1 mannitol dehydrogenase domain protein [Limosilactobacillus coleohominis 101-4-CHN]
MVKITDDYKKDKQAFAKAGIKVPTYSQEEIAKKTLAAPRWVHFGGGNLFRAFHAAIASHLIDAGKLDEGIIVVDTHDDSIIENVYKKFNNRMLRVITKADGSQDRELFAPVADAIYTGPVTDDTSSLEKLKDIFNQASLQLATFSITEKGYALKDAEGNFFAPVAHDIENEPAKPQNNMSLLVTLLLSRFKNGATPIALLSTDNFSENGDKLKDSVLTIAKAWQKNGFVDQDFIDYLSDDSKVSFPLSMIDRITPNPSETVSESLKKDGFEDADLIHTESHTTIAAFTNTEEAHYLVVEDKFPNGRPAFEDDGVIMTDRDTVNLADQMKVTACLNPLHTALAIYGTILDFKSISSEVQDPDMKRLILQIGYGEDLPVVQDPKVLSPRDFIDELVNKRLPNPYIPDTPQRIAADTSQKVGIRYGVTIQHYVDDPKRNPADLNFIPLVIATWLRYLMGINDEGEKFQPSPDPLWDDLHAQVADIKFGDANQDVHDAIKGILSNKSIFGNDLYVVGLGDKIESDFKEMLAGKGTIRKTLQKHLDEESKNFD